MRSRITQDATVFSLARNFAVAGLMLAATFATCVQAQTISTFAGNGNSGFSGDGGPATSAAVYGYGLARDDSGNIYIADPANYRIRKVTPGGIISTVAGNGSIVDSGDGGPALDAGIGEVFRVAVDRAGNLYLPSNRGHRIRKVTPAGIITTVAGTGVEGSGGDGGAATSADLQDPFAIAVDPFGNLLFTERASGARVRKVTPSGIITTIAGTGGRGFSGDGGLAINATFEELAAIDADSAGNVFLVDALNHRIRRIDSSGVISTIAGNGTAGFSGNGGSATAASLNRPYDVKRDASGNLYIADTNNNQIRKIDSTGTITAFAGTGTASFSGDGGPASIATLSLPLGLVLGGGKLYIADLFNYRVRQIDLFSTCAAEGFVARQLSLCRQICEVSQSSDKLTRLIKTYTAIYHIEPPCGR